MSLDFRYIMNSQLRELIISCNLTAEKFSLSHQFIR